MAQSRQHNNIDNAAIKSPLKLSLSSNDSALNLGFFKQIIHAQLTGKIVLPHGLGLDKISYLTLTEAINDHDIFEKERLWLQPASAYIHDRAAFCGELFSMKDEERAELIDLLSQYRNQQDPFSKHMAVIIATASLAKFHLWESLGLNKREDLGKIIQYNFPKLFALNTDNMRWKRFFYRQLCEQGGDYICRAPSCQECHSYRECFVS